MNRLKVWLFTLLVVAAAAVTLRAHVGRLRAGELAELDARLESAATQVSAAARALAREASAAAALAAGDARLTGALAAMEPAQGPAGVRRRVAPVPPPPVTEAEETALRDTARAALAAAERALGFELPGGTVVTAGSREWLARKSQAGDAEGEAVAFLRAAIDGKAERGWARLDGALFHAAAAPVGPGAGLVVLVPVDDAWVRAAASAAGVDLTVSAPTVQPLSTAPAADSKVLSEWSLGASAAAGVGRLGEVDLSIGPVALPKVPSLIGELPARRARAVALDGLEKGFAVVSLSTVRPLGEVVAFEWYAFVGLAAVLFLGLVFGLLVRPAGDGPTPVPEELVSAAARIEKGDFAARAPALAGKLGMVAAALNRAAELAGPAAAAATARPLVSDQPFAGLVRPEGADGPGPSLLPLPSSSPEPRAAPAVVASEMGERPPYAAEPFGAPGPFYAIPAPPRAAPPPPPEPPAAAPAVLLQSAAQAAPPASPAASTGDEESHWRQVYDEFLRTRASCGEATEGLAYERFRAKLEGNRATLVAKYSCKTVKFQVYVKDGKAALRATPVK
jgi:hypothetical protein